MIVVNKIHEETKEIFDALEDAVHIINSEGIILYVNPAWEVMHEQKYDDVIGVHINKAVSHHSFFIPSMHGMDFDENSPGFFEKASESLALRAMRERRTVNCLTYSYKKNRLNVTSIPIIENGDVKFVFTIVRDLSRLYELYDELNLHMERRNLYTDEMDYYRNNTEPTSVIGVSPAIRSLVKKMEYVAATDATILITGESGVGKEVFSNEIYRLSNRNGRPFLRINCAAIPENLLESELFGHERGAFTGAVRTKPGMFEVANKGTLMLDEIGELPKAMQSKLLRVLQENEIMHVGGTTPIPVDVRLICATNQHLEEMVEKGDFRKDLFYRINLIPLYIPPLRERPEDLDPLAAHFLSKYNTKYNKHKFLTANALNAMKNYSWPGNIRELENLLERLVIIGEENAITYSQVARMFSLDDIPADHDAADDNLPLKVRVENVEKEIIQVTLNACGSTYKAAEILKVPQSTLARKAKQYGLTWPNNTK